MRIEIPFHGDIDHSELLDWAIQWAAEIQETEEGFTVDPNDIVVTSA